jgi:heat shock protein HslJ
MFAFIPGLAQANPGPAPSAIPPIVWELVEYTEIGGAPVRIAEPSRYTLQFLADGVLVAGLDCNHGSGGYAAGNGVISVSALMSTLIGCPSDSQVEPFVRLLKAATTFQIGADGYLVLRGAEGELRLRPALGGVA